MPTDEHEDRDYTAESDQTYFDAIKPAILACMIEAKRGAPDVDHLIVVIEETTTSRVYASRRKEWLRGVRELLREKPIKALSSVVDRVSNSPSHPSAWWVVLARRNGTFLACSILTAPVSL